MTKPIFEIMDGEHHYRIYLTGQIEGFELGEGAKIFNRIPTVMATEIFKQVRYFNKCQASGAPTNLAILLSPGDQRGFLQGTAE